jgi:hypothetical protein
MNLAPREHVEARTGALLASAAVALRENRIAEARSWITEADTIVAPTEYRDLRERATQMAERAGAGSPAR